MFHQSMSRSQRSKGSKVKTAVQVTVLLAVVVWLLYQMKHSYGRKTEFSDTDYNKLRKGGMDINLGRKVNVGSQNAGNVDPDETTETKENGVDGNAWNPEETAEVEKESEESFQGITNNSNVDDNGEVNTEGAQDGLRFPSQRESDNLDHNKTKNDNGSSLEENEFPKEGATGNSDGESTAFDEAFFTEHGQKAGQESENGEIGGENGDNAEPLTQETSNPSVSDDQIYTNVSEDKDTNHEGEAIEAQGDTQSETETASGITEGDAAANARSEILNENINLPNPIDENNVATKDSQEGDSQVGNNSTDAASAKAGSENGNSNLVMPDGNGSSGTEEGESLVDVNLESQATGNNSIGAVNDDKNSEGENGDLPNSNEENSSSVMSDSNGAPKDEEVQYQMDNSKEDSKTDTSGDKVVKENDLKSSDAAVEEDQSQENGGQDSIEEHSSNVMSANNGAPKDEEVQSQTDNSSEDAKTDTAGGKQSNTDVPQEAATDDIAVKEDDLKSGVAAVKQLQSQDTSGQESIEEKSDDVVSSSAQNNEKNNSAMQNDDDALNEEVASDEDNAGKVVTVSNNVEDSMTELESKDETTSDSGEDVELSSSNKTAENEQGGDTSESSIPGSNEGKKKII